MDYNNNIINVNNTESNLLVDRSPRMDDFFRLSKHAAVATV